MGNANVILIVSLVAAAVIVLLIVVVIVILMCRRKKGTEKCEWLIFIAFLQGFLNLIIFAIEQF